MGFGAGLFPDVDASVRVAAFRWLRTQVDLHGDSLPWSVLSRGFDFDGRRVPLLGQQGIFKPAVLPEIPLSIRTSHDGPYPDEVTPDRLFRYCYRGTDPSHRENVGLRKALSRRTPLVYFVGLAPGRYEAIWPVFIVGDDPARLAFTVAADDVRFAEDAAAGPREAVEAREAEGRRAYVTAAVRVRLHQRRFRERVLSAYREECTLCRLRHRDLLDAAHIIPDSDPHGEPLVKNGLSLCKIHHAAFDHQLIGVRPDYIVEVHPRVLKEEDGPMLRHGLQGMHNASLHLPRAKADHPDRDRLEERYRKFRGAA